MRRPTPDGTRYRLRSSNGTGSKPTTPEVGPINSPSTTIAKLTIGLDLGDRMSRWCVVDGAGRVLERGQVRTVGTALTGCRRQGVIAGAGDAVQRAEPRHGVLVPVHVDERERVSFCVAQNRRAFLRGRAPPAGARAHARVPGAGGSPAEVAPSLRPPASRAAAPRALPSATVACRGI
jgi:hypothetical protein